MKFRPHFASAFSLWKLALVIAVILVAVALGAVLLLQRTVSSDDDELRLSNVRALRRSLMKASRDSMFLVGCVTGDPIQHCRVCTAERCREADDRTKTYLPSALFDPDGNRAEVCRAASDKPCVWSIEQEGTTPLSLSSFRIRFFLEKSTGDGASAGMHVLNSFGTIE